MKKYLLIFLGIFSLFFITENVNAEDLSSYLFVSATTKVGDISWTSGSQQSAPWSATNNYFYLNFGYYNITNLFKPGDCWRIKADYCITRTNFSKYEFLSSSNIDSYDLSYVVGDTCVYTDSQGNVGVGTRVSFTFTFNISSTDYTTGFVRYQFLYPGAEWYALGFLDYRIYPSSEITDTDNTQDIIDNSNKNQQETNDRLDNINGSLNDDTAPDTSNAFSDIKLNTNSAISNLVLMPINYLNRVLNLSKNTCSAYSLDFGIFNSDYKLNLPCIKLENFFGAQWWNVIDYLICFYMIYNIIMLAISAFEDITSLRDSYDSLYQPKHADTGYKPKHGGD